jgi:DNA/RNA-binding domain of Phe-tRNA-synthetase-like protein
MIGDLMKFIFSSDAYQLGVRGCYFSIYNTQNKSSDDPAVLNKITEILSHYQNNETYHNIVEGFSKLHKTVNLEDERLQASSKSLYNYYSQQGKLPQINGIVDIYNAFSFVSGLALGAHDIDKTKGDITLKLTTGQELYWPIGSNRKQKTGIGEYAYIDDTPEILCRLEVRQVEKTKITLESKNIFFIVQGHQDTEENYIKQKAQELHDTILALFGGNSEWY